MEIPFHELKDFNQRIGGLPAGGTLVYHQGSLAVDRRKDTLVQLIAHRVETLQLARAGYLFQRRVAEGVFEYLFVRSARAWPSSDELAGAEVIINSRPVA